MGNGRYMRICARSEYSRGICFLIYPTPPAPNLLKVNISSPVCLCVCTFKYSCRHQILVKMIESPYSSLHSRTCSSLIHTGGIDTLLEEKFSLLWLCHLLLAPPSFASTIHPPIAIRLSEQNPHLLSLSLTKHQETFGTF